jgi:8-oxo-dGTP pyrophosphatase MutT (NUDIX family)
MMNAKQVLPPEPLPAATLILARELQSELQVYLLKRHAKSSFMGGSYVFPGGILDSEDWEFTVWKNHVDLATEGFCNRLGGGGLTAEQIMAYGVAAIRETLEEAGVFLASRINQNKADLKRVANLRYRAELPREWFLNLIVSEGWTLALSALYRWSHWITPLLMKRRYDTRFFLACMPPGQHCQPDSHETTHGLWISPRKGLAANIAGQVPLAPPTMVMLQALLEYPTLADLKKTAQTRTWGLANVPRLIPLKKGAVLLEPWDPDYHQPDIDIDADRLAKLGLPAGEPFSRLWDCEGIWRPIAK